jgi:Protein of unknown function (DUF4058)
MPSPFSSMGPDLERDLWTTFYFAFGAEMMRQLAPRLRPHYLVLPIERFVIEISNCLLCTSGLRPA